MNEDSAWAAVEAALSTGRLIGADPGDVERYETHMSVVVLASDVVYKLKKPVRFGYADYSSAELRREMCEAEVVLNRRLAPGLYLGTAAVVEEGAHLRLVEGSHDDALEHLVLMQRIDPEQLLDARLYDDVPPAVMHEIGATIARFHLSAAPVVPDEWSPERIRADLTARFELLRTRLTSPLDRSALTSVEEFLERWLRANAVRISDRAEQGWVRDGHGDLRTEHVVVSDPIAVIDCVEFSASLRSSDVLSDLAFLVMELELGDRHDLARATYEAWAAEGGPLDEDLLWAYASMRALIRVEVTLDRAEQIANDPIRHQLVVEHAQQLLQVAERLTWARRPPVAILIGGLSGSGKSTISGHLARQWRLDRIGSDGIRKTTLGLRTTQIAPPQAYLDIVSKRVYEQLGKRAGEALEAGRSIIVDATFRRTADCESFQLGLARATTTVSNVVSLGLTAEPEVLRERVLNRERRGGSDATVEVLERQFEECPERLPAFPGSIAISTNGSFGESVLEVSRAVLERTTPGA